MAHTLVDPQGTCRWQRSGVTNGFDEIRRMFILGKRRRIERSVDGTSLRGDKHASQRELVEQLNQEFDDAVEESDLESDNMELLLPQESTNATDQSLNQWIVRIRDQIKPQGDASNDDSWDQRALNVVTSLPFLFLGAHMLQVHASPQGKMYAKSMIGVGVSATLYHASQGSFRRLTRKLDYYTISFAASRMIRSLWPENNSLKHILRSSMVAVPFKPFLLSTACTLAMQAEFVHQGMKYEAVRPHLLGHGLASAAGACAFALEDTLADAGFKHTHSLWHCLSAYSVYTTSRLIKHKEDHMRRRIHDSAMSLEALDIPFEK